MLRAVWAVSQGQFSLRVVVVASLSLLWCVILLAAYMMLFRAYHNARLRYRAARAALYQPAIEMVLMEEPYEKILAALRPRRWGDADISQGVMIESMRHLEGPPFETLQRAAEELGYVGADVHRLTSAPPYRRGRAMDALGVMRCTRTIPDLLRALEREKLELRLVALRALAAIGDPAVLPVFVDQADKIPPPLLPRMVSLVFEFGAPGRVAATEIVNRHPNEFPPGAVRDILMQLSVDLEAPR